MAYEIAWIAGTLGAAFPFIKRRLELSHAKHPSLAGHSRMAKRMARWIPGYAYDETAFFGCDGAPDDVLRNRRAGFFALAGRLQAKSPRSIALTLQAREGIPDLRFTGAYRVPYQFSPYLREHLKVGGFV